MESMVLENESEITARLSPQALSARAEMPTILAVLLSLSPSAQLKLLEDKKKFAEQAEELEKTVIELEIQAGKAWEEFIAATKANNAPEATKQQKIAEGSERAASNYSSAARKLRDKAADP